MIVVSSLIAVVYVGRIVEVAWFREPASTAAAEPDLPIEMVAVTWLLTAATIYFGIDTAFTAGLAERAADALLAGIQ